MSVSFADPPRRTTSEVFASYSDDDFAFARTRPSVKLAEIGTAFVSRSEAKRLLDRLESFAEVD